MAEGDRRDGGIAASAEEMAAAL